MTSDEGSAGQAPRPDEQTGAESLPRRVAAVVRQRQDVITADVVALFPFQGPQRLDTNYCLRLGGLVVLGLADAVEHGRIDHRSQAVGELASVAAERSLAPDQFFAFVHIAERTATDELSLDFGFGATTEPWPLVSGLVREAALGLLAAWTTRVAHAPSPAALTDTLTTLHTRAVFDAALGKECHRAERFGHPFAVLLIDVDALGELNESHGYGVGDRVLERLGILLRTFFRHYDWVARYEEDAFAVLLPETVVDDAAALAERARTMVGERLAFRDYRTERRVVVTVSVGVVTVQGVESRTVDPAVVLAAAEDASRRSKSAGHTVVEPLTPP
jgi:diguanylate cyclase (GGDEF)-like protein